MADNAPNDSSATVGGFHETYAISRGNGASRELTGAVVDQFAGYEQRATHMDALLHDARTGQNRDPRLQAYADLIDVLKRSDDRGLTLSVVNAWVNTIVKYDDAKYLTANDPNTPNKLQNWLQTPDQTLMSGTGTCADIALLKYETLRQLGFRDSDMRLVIGTATNTDGKSEPHMVLSVNVSGKNTILDSQQLDFKQHPIGDFTPVSELKRMSTTHGNIYADSDFVNGVGDAAQYGFFLPQLSYNRANGVMQYDPPATNAIPPPTPPVSAERTASFKQSVERLGGGDVIGNVITAAARLNPEYIPYRPGSPTLPVHSEPLPDITPRAHTRKNHASLRAGPPPAAKPAAVKQERGPTRAPQIP